MDQIGRVYGHGEARGVLSERVVGCGNGIGGESSLDIVALGTDDMPWHGALAGSKWWAHWERLDVFGNSAPLLTEIEVPPPWSPMVAVFVLGTDGQVNHALWNVSSEFSWRGSTWSSMGGNLTVKYYRS